MMKFLIFLQALLLVTLSVASDCEPGSFMQGGVCRLCPKGTFQENADQTSCVPCAVGTVATEAGSTVCEPCGENEEPNEQMSACTCVEGSKSLRRGGCALCEPGFYGSRNRRGRSNCRQCGENQFQPEAGQTECLDCPEGSASSYGATECVTCSEDQFVGDDMRCISCGPGAEFQYGYCNKCQTNFFKKGKGLGPCLPCPVGSHSGRGKSKCIECPMNSTLMRRGMCGSCEAGEYFDSYSRRCRKCEVGFYQPNESVRTSCFDCPRAISGEKGQTTCESCDLGMVPVADGRCEVCSAGRIYDEYRRKCKRCGFNEFSRGDMDYCQSCSSGSFARRGATTCFTCPRGEAFISDEDDCGKCPAGSYYEQYSAICSECYFGFQPNENIEETCRSCPAGQTSNGDYTACVPEN